MSNTKAPSKQTTAPETKKGQFFIKKVINNINNIKLDRKNISFMDHENKREKKLLITTKKDNKSLSLPGNINNKGINNIKQSAHKHIKSPQKLQNVNKYLQLIDSHGDNSNVVLSWALSLRENGRVGFKHLNIEKTNEPSFYAEDLKKFSSRISNKFSDSDISVPNFAEIHHATVHRVSSAFQISKSYIKTMLNLRHIPLKKKSKIIQREEWNNSEGIKKKDDLDLCELNRENYKYLIKEKYIIRPFKKTFKKIRYWNMNIRKKILERDNEKAYNKNFDISGLLPYQDRFEEKNYAKIYHHLNNKTQDINYTHFIYSLRGSDKTDSLKKT